MTDPFPNRPKRMRWATYNRLKAKADELELKGDPQGLNRAEKEAASRLGTIPCPFSSATQKRAPGY